MVEIGRIVRRGASNSVTLPERVSRSVDWKPGDRIAIRQAGEKLILERVPLEELAKLKLAPAEGTPA